MLIPIIRSICVCPPPDPPRISRHIPAIIPAIYPLDGAQHNRNHNLLHFISFSRAEELWGCCAFCVLVLFARFHFALYALQQFLNGRLAVLLTLVHPGPPPDPP